MYIFKKISRLALRVRFHSCMQSRSGCLRYVCPDTSFIFYGNSQIQHLLQVNMFYSFHSGSSMEMCLPTSLFLTIFKNKCTKSNVQKGSVLTSTDFEKALATIMMISFQPQDSLDVNIGYT